VFVGGGFRRKADSLDIFRYNINDNTWTTLPRCPAFHQGLTTLNGELISIGGVHLREATNISYTLKRGRWKEVLLPMPTPRYLLSTVSHKNEVIIAAGGITGITLDGKDLRTELVELYIKDGQQWYSTTRLPFQITAISMCIIDETCYVLGGAGAIQDVRQTLCASVPMLIKEAVSTSECSHSRARWNTLERTPLVFSSLVEIGRKLIGVGGSYDEVLRQGTKSISYYDFVADMWVECTGAQLPVPLYRPGVVKLADNKVMVIGGQPEMQKFSSEVYIGCCTN
jgi:N-acetylneuraminic acid mutarotase